MGIGPLSVPWNVPSQILPFRLVMLGMRLEPATFECEPSLIQQPAFAVHFRLMVGHASSQSRKRTARMACGLRATRRGLQATNKMFTQNSKGQTSVPVNSLNVGASQHQARRSQPDLRRWNGRERSAFRPPEAVPDRSCGGIAVPWNAERSGSSTCKQGVSPTFGRSVTDFWKLVTVTDVWKLLTVNDV